MGDSILGLLLLHYFNLDCNMSERELSLKSHHWSYFTRHEFYHLRQIPQRKVARFIVVINLVHIQGLIGLLYQATSTVGNLLT